MELSTLISLILGIAFPALLIYWAIVRFRQRHKNPSLSVSGLDGGMYEPNGVASSIAWQQNANRIDEVAITLDIDAPRTDDSPQERSDS